jgi:hypothetical protein
MFRELKCFSDNSGIISNVTVVDPWNNTIAEAMTMLYIILGLGVFTATKITKDGFSFFGLFPALYICLSWPTATGDRYRACLTRCVYWRKKDPRQFGQMTSTAASTKVLGSYMALHSARTCLCSRGCCFFFLFVIKKIPTQTDLTIIYFLFSKPKNKK